MAYENTQATVLRTVFDEAHEILLLGGRGTAQAADVANRHPGIAEPAVDSDDMARMLENGCYMALDPASGVPAVEIRDEDDPLCYGLGGTINDPLNSPRAVLVTPAGAWVPPMHKPMVFPPTARYLAGLVTAEALYPIGGWVANNDSDYLLIPIVLHASRQRISFSTCRERYLFEFTTLLTQAAGGAVTKTCKTPLFIMPQWGSLHTTTDYSAVLTALAPAATFDNMTALAYNYCLHGTAIGSYASIADTDSAAVATTAQVVYLGAASYLDLQVSVNATVGEAANVPVHSIFTITFTG